MNDALWRPLQDAFDRRADPFDDPEVVAALLADPDAIGRVARLRAELRSLALPAGRRRRRRGAVAAAAVLAVALLVAAGVGLRRSVGTPDGAPAQANGSALVALTCEWRSSGGEVVRYELSAHGESWTASTARAGLTVESTTWRGGER